LPQLGGQLAALYPEKNIYDVAGFPSITAQGLVDQLDKQMEVFNPTIVLDEPVEKVEKQKDDSFKLTTTKGVHRSKTIIITAGNGVFLPRKLKLEDCEKYENTNLQYQVNNMEQYKDKNVLLLGGGDSAVDWALMLEPIAKKVTLAHRRDDFRAHEQSVSQLKESSVDILTPFVPEMIKGEKKAEQVTLQEVRGEKRIDLDVDYILC